MNKDERKALFFSFYDQLKPEHAAQAKNDYSDEWASESDGCPMNLHESAIIRGIREEVNTNFWNGILDQIEAGTYPLQLTPQECTRKAKESMRGLPKDSEERKTYPLYSLVTYFGDALAEVANLSYQGNQQHHPDEPLHWDKDKSTDSRDALMRHIFDMEKANKELDHDTEFDEAKRVAWRAIENLQRLIENKCQYTTKEK